MKTVKPIRPTTAPTIMMINLSEILEGLGDGKGWGGTGVINKSGVVVVGEVVVGELGLSEFARGVMVVGVMMVEAVVVGVMLVGALVLDGIEVGDAVVSWVLVVIAVIGYCCRKLW